MYADLPPKLWTPPAQEIVRPSIEVPWEIQANQKLVELGIPRDKRRAVIHEIQRLSRKHFQGGSKEVLGWAGVPEAKQSNVLLLFYYMLGKEPKNCKFLSVQSTDASASPTTTFSYSNVDIGAPDPDRYIILAFSAQRTGGITATVSALTHAGNSFTQVVYRNNNQPNGIYIRSYPTGGAGTLALTMNSNMNTVVIGVYRAILSSATAFATLSANLSNPNLGGNINITTLGIVVACCSMWTSSSSNWTNTWTGATERYDLFPVGNAGGAPSGAMSDQLSAETNRLVRSTLSSNTSEGGMVAASW